MLNLKNNRAKIIKPMKTNYKLIELAKEKCFNAKAKTEIVGYVGQHELLYYLWLCELKKWLNDEKNIIVSSNHYEYACKQDNGWRYTIGTSIKTDFSSGKYKTYEKALEEGIYETLKLIKI